MVAMYLLRRILHMDNYKSRQGADTECSKLTLRFGKKGRGRNCFNMPCGIAVTKSGDIVVADSENHRVQIFTSEGILKVKFGSKGIRPDQINYPMCLAMTNEENIAVTDSVNACIKIFTQEGNLVQVCGSSKFFEFPYGLAISPDGDFVVTDICKHCVTVMTKNGEFSHSFGSYGDSPRDFDHPYFVTVNKQKQILVSDSGNSCIKLFRFDGHLLRSFTLQDFHLSVECYANLQGMCSDADGNTLVICNSTIYILAKNGRLWEVITPKDGLTTPKCVSYCNNGFLAVTQSGYNEIHEVCLFDYNKDDYKSLNTLLYYAIDI
ncbi:tripartite motif-containing protein 2 [Octopus bimaculoides]|uniref:Uncharacterized protein n=1 Tax=Octopus bimaculoides TaxID=37653 RepID=A0A0L8IB31_OCTBM|nr:tripartite motif-containing protein 2 [Octopus bimaculoides]XP_014783470.1 tripartite motif-containing protein 2 [Octopus bimaculoides]XP_052822960.1 tripartite motif-containing protein 2 [Octopus bimaculoides]|eukprot:XP_014783460.1 PREDICTED: tripartite motif-containing protein 2-like [Octopus bimaculoides]